MWRNCPCPNSCWESYWTPLTEIHIAWIYSAHQYCDGKPMQRLSIPTLIRLCQYVLHCVIVVILLFLPFTLHACAYICVNFIAHIIAQTQWNLMELNTYLATWAKPLPVCTAAFNCEAVAHPALYLSQSFDWCWFLVAFSNFWACSRLIDSLSNTLSHIFSTTVYPASSICSLKTSVSGRERTPFSHLGM